MANEEFRSKRKRSTSVEINRENSLVMTTDWLWYGLVVNISQNVKSRGVDMKRNKQKKLLHAKLNNIKEYWKLLSRNGNTKNSTRVTIDDFFNHFVSLSNPNDDFYVADDDVISNMNALLNDDLCEKFQELNMPILVSEVAWAVKEKSVGGGLGFEWIFHSWWRSSCWIYHTPF